MFKQELDTFKQAFFIKSRDLIMMLIGFTVATVLCWLIYSHVFNSFVLMGKAIYKNVVYTLKVSE